MTTLSPPPLEIALVYIARGWNPVPNSYQSKKPIGDAWQTRLIDEQSAPDYFNSGQQNVGVQLGAHSHGLTDMDLDAREAVAIGSYLLPPTKSIFGRSSKRASHWEYYSDLSTTQDIAAIQFRAPDHTMLLELRVGGGDLGAQTIFPGSVHDESGEPIEWEENGEPADVDGAELITSAKLVAAAALIARGWPAEGGRHDAALALGGLLARAGFSAEKIKLVAEAIARAAGDEEWRDRVKAAEDQAQAYHAGGKAYGSPKLIEIVGKESAKLIAQWLDYDAERPSSPALRSYYAEELERRLVEAVDWSVENYVPNEAVTGLFGDGGTGKDLLLFMLGACAISGSLWLGKPVKQGRVLYYPVEDNDKELRRRQAAIAEHYGIRFADYPRQFKITPLAGKDTVLAAFDQRSGVVKPTPLYSTIRKQIEDFKPQLVIVGNRVNIFGVNQNDDAQARQCMQLLSAIALDYQAAVIMPGHVSVAGITSGSGTSGSVQWSNACRSRLFLSRCMDENRNEPDPDARLLEVRKANWGPTNRRINLRWSDGVFVVETDATKTFVEKLQESEAEQEFLRMLELYAVQRVNPQQTAPNYAPKLFSDDPRCRCRNRNGKRLLAKAMASLLQQGFIEIEEYGSPANRHQKLVRRAKK